MYEYIVYYDDEDGDRYIIIKQPKDIYDIIKLGYRPSIISVESEEYDLYSPAKLIELAKKWHTISPAL